MRLNFSLLKSFPVSFHIIDLQSTRRYIRTDRTVNCRDMFNKYPQSGLIFHNLYDISIYTHKYILAQLHVSFTLCKKIFPSGKKNSVFKPQEFNMVKTFISSEILLFFF